MKISKAFQTYQYDLVMDELSILILRLKSGPNVQSGIWYVSVLSSQSIVFCEADEGWAVNVHQAKVVNLQLPARLYFWGVCKHTQVVIVTDSVNILVMH